MEIQSYRERLLAAGFIEAGRHAGRFYRELTSLTAFHINLTEQDGHLRLVYGCSSTALAKADGSDHLTRYSLDHADITLRRGLTAKTDADLAAHEPDIRAFYAQYAPLTKDELLAVAKAWRKDFVAIFTARLKPLGFRKQSNTWRKLLENGYSACLYLQKSSYSDAYYYNIYLERGDPSAWNHCYETRVAPDDADNDPHDWQLTPRAEMEAFVDGVVLRELTRLTETPIPELGRDPATWRHCLCQRNRCEECLIERNLWEAQATE